MFTYKFLVFKLPFSIFKICMQLNKNDVKEILKEYALGIELKFWKKHLKWKENIDIVIVKVRCFSYVHSFLKYDLKYKMI